MKLEFRGLLLYFVRKISKTILSWNLLSLCCLFTAIKELVKCRELSLAETAEILLWDCLWLNVNTCFFTHLLMIDNNFWMFLTAEILATFFILRLLSYRCELNTDFWFHTGHTHTSPGWKSCCFFEPFITTQKPLCSESVSWESCYWYTDASGCFFPTPSFI